MTPTQNPARASLAPKIVWGSEAERYQLWLELTGQAPPEDLSKSYMVQHGKYLEPFVLDWIAAADKVTIGERQRALTHRNGVHTCTLDGYVESWDAVIECKVLNPFQRPDSVGDEIGFLHYYAPQLAIQKDCRGARQTFLLVQQGNSEPQLFDVPIDEAYTREVLERTLAFHACVTSRTPPSKPPDPPVPPERWRTVSLDAQSSENWVQPVREHLTIWRGTKAAHAQHEQAKKDVKEVLPADIGRATYGAITISRSRSGSVSIREGK